MACDGWIKLYRQFTQHTFWNEKRVFSRAEAWLDILFHANYIDRKELIKGKLIEFKRGEWHTSELKLSRKWRWSRNKVRLYLLMLEQEEMITRKGTPDGTTLTVVKYEVYQSEGTTKATPHGTPEGTPTSTPDGTQTKKDKKEKKDKNNIVSDYTENEKFTEAINDFIQMRNKIKKPLTDKALSLLLNKLDKLGHSDAEKIEILNQSTMNCWQGVFELKKPIETKPALINWPPKIEPVPDCPKCHGSGVMKFNTLDEHMEPTVKEITCDCMKRGGN